MQFGVKYHFFGDVVDSPVDKAFPLTTAHGNKWWMAPGAHGKVSSPEYMIAWLIKTVDVLAS